MAKYFTIRELSKSSTATLLGIDNTPDENITKNLTELIDKVLDPLREAYGKPIIVTSGYRCPALNKAVGGSASSQHMTGLAVDIRTVKDTPEDNKKLFDLAQELNLPYDLLINEYNFDWVHISCSPKNRKQIVVIK